MRVFLANDLLQKSHEYPLFLKKYAMFCNVSLVVMNSVFLISPCIEEIIVNFYDGPYAARWLFLCVYKIFISRILSDEL